MTRNWTEEEYAAALARGAEPMKGKPALQVTGNLGWPIFPVNGTAPARGAARSGRAVCTPGPMNKYEFRYAEHLELRRIVGEIQAWWFEGIKLRLAKATSYTPDFLVQLANGSLEMHEVKGFWEDDARVKIKVAAEMFPCFRFLAVTWERSEWRYERF